MNDVMTVILAGGKGTRLEPLTLDRSKPAVPFGGIYRIIDFVLSNCINSGLRRMLLLTQYKAASLDRHVNTAWQFLCRELGEFIDVLPPQQRIGEHWYRGTADAVYQNIYTIEQSSPRYVLILSGDHIYKMDYRPFIDDLIRTDADCSIACLAVPLNQGREFGVMGIDSNHWVNKFDEKPENPSPIPGNPESCLASMGIYAFKASFLFDELFDDAGIPQSSHDFGKDLIPKMIQGAKVRAFPAKETKTGEPIYWRDVGTTDAFYEASLDLVSVEPNLNLYDLSWPIRGYSPPLPPPKFVFADEETQPARVGTAIDSIVAPGSILSGGKVIQSIISHSVRINSFAEIRRSIIHEGVSVGRSCKIRNAIVDKDVFIPPHTTIGYDQEQDELNHLVRTTSGITVIPKGHRFS